MRARLFVSFTVTACALLRAPPARADDDVARARQEFLEGASYIRELQYADALAAFERSAKLRPHAVTTYNIGACQRALGKYTLARQTLREALERDARANRTELSDSLRSEANGFLAQIEGVLARVDVVLAPTDAALAVDGQPLRAEGDALVAGTRPPGPPERPPSGRFTLVVDPGPHVFTVARKGFGDAVVNKAFTPGARATLSLELDRLPATLAFSSSQSRAVVTVDGVDVGVAPVDIQRPAGRYHVAVRRPGFVPYEADVDAHAGERIDLRANLKEETRSLTSRWWFWTAAGVIVAGVAAGTYVATRPEPERPPLNGGGLGWTLQAQ